VTEPPRRVRPVRGRPAAWLEAGSGPPLVLVHGAGGSADLWLPQLDGLADVARVVAPGAAPRRLDRRAGGSSGLTMPLIRITSGGVGPSGVPSGGRARRLLGLGLVDLRAGTISRVWPWRSLANCQNIGGKIVCTR
jgi:pimeloyl-ACP methyl ester carboxylesterase